MEISEKAPTLSDVNYSFYLTVEMEAMKRNLKERAKREDTKVVNYHESYESKHGNFLHTLNKMENLNACNLKWPFIGRKVAHNSFLGIREPPKREREFSLLAEL